MAIKQFVAVAVVVLLHGGITKCDVWDINHRSVITVSSILI